MPKLAASASLAAYLNTGGSLHSTMKNGESDESIVKVNVPASWAELKELEARVIALERGLEGVLRRLEASSSPDDEAGWFGRPE
jgi:hypothetical protein